MRSIRPKREGGIGWKGTDLFNEVSPEEYRVDLCVKTDIDISGNELGLVKITIPAGRYAVLKHIGSDDTLADSIKYLYADWFPDSGEEMRDFPLYVQRVKFFPDVPENETETDIYLPLK
ncbi:MAG: GyrI-like domain-containing protein [Gammaproteobacteria bacterium]|nr:GyrI-like domain-containing protein [Gammaproteobacteria bacterium]